MSIKAMTWSKEQRLVKKPAERHVLLCLADYAGEDGRNAFPAVARIARETGFTRKGVQNILRRLEEAGAIRPGNNRIAEAHIARADKRPTVYDLAIEKLSNDAPSAAENPGENAGERGERGTPGDATGRTPRPNGANATTERGERGTPDPSLNHHKNLRAREGGDPDGPPSPAAGGARGEGAPRSSNAAAGGDGGGASDGEGRRRALIPKPLRHVARDLILDWIVGGEINWTTAMRLKFGKPPDHGGIEAIADFKIPRFNFEGDQAWAFIAALPLTARREVTGQIAWVERWIANSDPNKPFEALERLEASLRDCPLSDERAERRNARVAMLRDNVQREIEADAANGGADQHETDDNQQCEGEAA
ncbi:MAG: hypothetical protein DHS20C04_31920 [Hyphococcus sp.]|nr:MAG: hypothetical protein DHS20C04_31920 [Marinicaulis sp.]